MTLGDLIAELRKHDQEKVVRNGFCDPHSYRGYYSCLALTPCGASSVAELLAVAISAVGATYQGYKGGDYLMSVTTPVYLACWGESRTDDAQLSLTDLRVMLLDTIDTDPEREDTLSYWRTRALMAEARLDLIRTNLEG